MLVLTLKIGTGGAGGIVMSIDDYRAQPVPPVLGHDAGPDNNTTLVIVPATGTGNATEEAFTA